MVSNITTILIKSSMVFGGILIQEKTGLKTVPKGGTSTGNIARRAFSDESRFRECIMSVVAAEYREPLSKLHTQLSAILRVVNSDRKINTEEFGNICTNTYHLILDCFPWANIHRPYINYWLHS